MQQAYQLEQEIRNSEAFLIQNRLIYLTDVFFVFGRNYHRLHQLLEAFSSPEAMMPIWDVDRRSDLRLAINELLTYLHNYLASAKTLVDHTRVMMNHAYEHHDFLGEYQSRVEADFTTDPLS
ncbi:MAG TPA: hypothetical protein VJK02_08545, partial [Anaerolineales bacterium]|nr:hypothetical protein [Anaerolineales bacterium]